MTNTRSSRWSSSSLAWPGSALMVRTRAGSPAEICSSVKFLRNQNPPPGFETLNHNTPSDLQSRQLSDGIFKTVVLLFLLSLCIRLTCYHLTCENALLKAMLERSRARKWNQEEVPLKVLKQQNQYSVFWINRNNSHSTTGCSYSIIASCSQVGQVAA